jgi:hypothetical protein
MGRLLVAYSRLILFAAILWAVLLEGRLIYSDYGWMGLLASFLAWPFAVICLPIYAGLKQGNWLPAALTYGGWVIYELLYRGGRALERWEFSQQQKKRTGVPRKRTGEWAR